MSEGEERMIAEGWLTTREAADEIGFSEEYLRRLARQEKVEGRKFAGRWLLDRDDLLAYKARMNELGRKKHDPYGIEHARETQDGARGGDDE